VAETKSYSSDTKSSITFSTETINDCANDVSNFYKAKILQNLVNSAVYKVRY